MYSPQPARAPSRVSLPIVVTQIQEWTDQEIELKNARGAINLVNQVVDDLRAKLEQATDDSVTKRDLEAYATRLEDSLYGKGVRDRSRRFGSFRGGTTSEG